MATQNISLLNRNEILKGLKELDDMPLFQSEEDGFILLAGALRLIANAASEDSMTADELNDCITDASWGFAGRKGDGGLDAFWINESSKEICLFQSKLEAIKRSEVSDFLMLPERLPTSEFLTPITNASLKESAQQFIEKLGQSYGIRLYFVTTGTPTHRDISAMQHWSESAISVPLGDGTALNPAHHAEFVNGAKFTEWLSEAPAQTSVNIGLKMDLASSFLHNDGENRMLLALIEGKEICRIFREEKFNIFRDNPRAVIAKSKVNARIRATLDDEERKKSFHLFNNGLNITCKNLTYPTKPTRSQKTYTSNIEDFQIVNGLQTSFTLASFELDRGDLEGVYVICKISESASLNSEISMSSNSQTAVTGWDLVSLDPRQSRLQKEFNEIPNGLRERRWFELKRGEAKYIEKLPGNTPIVKPKDLTQAMIAFTGNPVVAKNSMKEVEINISATSGHFQSVYKENTSAYHLLLAWKAWLFVRDRIQSELKKHALDGTLPPEWLSHSRYHIFGLIGVAYVSSHSQDSFLDLGLETLKEDLADVSHWAEDLYTKAYNAVDFVQAVQKQADADARRIFRARQLFLSESVWKRLEERMF